MATDSPPKPVPVPDEQSQEFWDAAAKHTLAIQRCQACGFYSYPPAMLCPNCLSPEREFRFEPVSGRGRMRTWTIMRQAFLPGFQGDIPYVVAEVELEEQPGLKMVMLLVDGMEAELSIGAPVEVVFEDLAEGMSVPHFKMVTQP